MERFNDVIQETNGDAVVTATVTIYNAVGGAISDIFDDDGVTPLNNPFTVTDINYGSDGTFWFKAANGDYNIKVVNGAATKWKYGVKLFDFEDATAPNDFTKTTDPTVDDDGTQGWEVGSRWLNTTTKTAFIAFDISTGAAVWESTTLNIEDLGTMAVQDAIDVLISGGLISGVDLSSSTIESSPIGQVSPQAGKFTDIQALERILVGDISAPNWIADRKYIAIGKSGSVSSKDISGTMSINANIYWDETIGYWTRIDDGEAAQYQISSSGNHSFQVAPSGLAGTIVVWDICLQITQDGDISVKNNAEFLGNVAVTGTVDGRDVSVDGAKLDTIASSANNYVHPSYAGDDASIDTGALTGANVISDLDLNVTTDTLGHVTDVNAAVATRALSAGDIGAQPAGTYNTQIETFDRVSSILSGANVFSNIVVSNGFVTAIATRALTLANLGVTATAAEVNYTTDVTSNIQAQLNLKAALASPALTGNPTAPTQTAGNNSTRLATTAFVTAALTAGGGGFGSYSTYSADTNYLAADDLVVCATFKEPGTNNTIQLIGYTDATATPTTERARSSAREGQYAHIVMFVKAGDYWKMATSGTGATSNLHFIPLH